MCSLRSTRKKVTTIALALLVGVSLTLSTAPPINAADHAEATLVAADPGADIADVFAFLDPNDNSKVVLALDVEGFVVPSELLNLSFFAPEVLFRFEIENTVAQRHGVYSSHHRPNSGAEGEPVCDHDRPSKWRVVFRRVDRRSVLL